jgi:ketosteroid isomerase-like protein
MQSWLGHKLISFVMRRTRAGDIRPTLLLDHPDVHLTFPGTNSWSGVYRGKVEVEAWLRRMTAVGLQTFPDEVVVTGPPGRSTVCVRGHDHLDAPDGRRVYENRFVIWGRYRVPPTRLRGYEVYADTDTPEALDDYLRQQRPALAG